MPIRALFWMVSVALMLFSSACSNPNPQPTGLTPIPSLAPGATLTLLPQIQGASPVATTAVSPAPSPQAGATGAATAARPTAAATAAGTITGDAAAGTQIYARNCASCHGAQAQGGVGPALRNNPFIETAGDAAVYATIANGRPGTAMPAWSRAKGGSLADTDIYNVIAYLHTLQNAP